MQVNLKKKKERKKKESFQVWFQLRAETIEVERTAGRDLGHFVYTYVSRNLAFICEGSAYRVSQVH